MNTFDEQEKHNPTELSTGCIKINPHELELHFIVTSALLIYGKNEREKKKSYLKLTFIGWYRSEVCIHCFNLLIRMFTSEDKEQFNFGDFKRFVL